jgi:hypothetical protein
MARLLMNSKNPMPDFMSGIILIKPTFYSLAFIL